MLAFLFFVFMGIVCGANRVVIDTSREFYAIDEICELPLGILDVIELQLWKEIVPGCDTLELLSIVIESRNPRISGICLPYGDMLTLTIMNLDVIETYNGSELSDDARTSFSTAKKYFVPTDAKFTVRLSDTDGKLRAIFSPLQFLEDVTVPADVVWEPIIGEV